MKEKFLEYSSQYCGKLSTFLKEIDYNIVFKVVELCLNARKNKKRIYIAGNGGSAATASHFSQDMQEIGDKLGLNNFLSISLCENIPLLTAISNDFSYEDIFALQIEKQFNEGDVLIVISASGNSPNVIKAVETANCRGGTTIGFVGFSGGRLAKICNYVVYAKTPTGEYGITEDVHSIICHLIVCFLLNNLKEIENV